MSEFPSFTPTDPSLFFKSQKTGDPRLGEIICHCVSKTDPKADDIIIAGYPDDEGIALNKGRLGASLGPDAIRQCLYKTSFFRSPDKKQNIIDIGNLNINSPLSDRHEKVKLNVKKALDKKMCWVGLGGGHDYGYPDGAGFLQANENPTNKPLILNFDAHLDVRPTDQGLSSGTPFYRLLTEKNLPAFDFLKWVSNASATAKVISTGFRTGGDVLFFWKNFSVQETLFLPFQKFLVLKT